MFYLPNSAIENTNKLHTTLLLSVWVLHLVLIPTYHVGELGSNLSSDETDWICL